MQRAGIQLYVWAKYNVHEFPDSLIIGVLIESVLVNTKKVFAAVFKYAYRLTVSKGEYGIKQDL